MKRQLWQITGTIARIQSRWVTIIAENLRDEQGKQLEYWRVERPDSLIVLPVYEESILLPKAKFYRHGIQQHTHDFPGGRMVPGESPQNAAYRFLEKELGYDQGDVSRLEAINDGWFVDSSFSNQKLYGMLAELNHIRDTVVACDPHGTGLLRQNLACLQCRALLLEYLLNRTA